MPMIPSTINEPPPNETTDLVARSIFEIKASQAAVDRMIAEVLALQKHGPEVTRQSNKMIADLRKIHGLLDELEQWVQLSVRASPRLSPDTIASEVAARLRKLL